MHKRQHVLNGALLGLSTGVLYAAPLLTGPLTDPLMALVTAVGVAVPVTLGALVPDIDTEYGRHRKTAHNVFVLAALALFPLWYGNLAWVWLGAVAHVSLDALASKRGVALFYPLSTREYSFFTGVSGDSTYATLVTLAVTGVQVAVIGAVLTL